MRGNMTNSTWDSDGTFDGWHIGELKQHGIILKIHKIWKNWNIVTRLQDIQQIKGGNFLEEFEVTRASIALEFDVIV